MPGDPLPVHVNREELHGLEVPASYETRGSFDVTLVNHGESVHVHLHLDDDLSTVASLDATNHFVDGNAQRPVRVRVDGEGPVRGKLKVVSAYGAQTRYVDVLIQEPPEEEQAVEVDESLAEPQPAPEEDEPSALAENPELVVLGLGAVALAVATAAALLLENLIVQLGALVVLAGVLAAAYVLLR